MDWPLMFTTRELYAFNGYKAFTGIFRGFTLLKCRKTDCKILDGYGPMNVIMQQGVYSQVVGFIGP